MKFKRHITVDLRMYGMAGIGRYLQNLLPDLIPRLNASKISILGRSDDVAGEDWLRDPRIQFREFRPRIFSAAEQWAAAAGEYRDIDLLWIPQYNLPLLYSGKLLVTIHDLCQLAHPETLANDLQRRYAKYLLSRVVKRASAILCVSEFTASEMQKYLHVDRERVVVAYPAMGGAWDTSTATRPQLPDPPYLLAVGNVKKHKNLPRLIAAFAGIRSQIPHDLIVVGKREGFLNSEALSPSISADLDGRVRFTGQVTDRELREYYRNATALIFPSLYEGFGFPLVEAMAEGCPIACSNVASLPEVAGDAALLFDPFRIEDIGRALLQITSDSALRDTLAERGRQRLGRFAGTTCAELTAATINRLLEA
jgi:glycosyltransferase involved in cell wall biosynthesis